MDNTINLETISLPKWPHFVVSGKAVTKEQAEEIIIRTISFWFSSNSENIETKLYQLIDEKLGFKYQEIDKDNFDNNWKRKRERNKFLESYNILDLEYLENTRVLSCWIGGPKGWINWDGTIGTCNYNIGKWPEADKVYTEWKLIAETFPYLDLQCQLMSGESGEETEPVIEYIIKDSKVEVKIPTEKLKSNVPYEDPTDRMIEMLHNKTIELGCSYKQFESALKYLKIEGNK